MAKTIVIIDDDPDDTDLFQAALKKIDQTVNLVVFNSSSEALDYLLDEEKTLPDYIILDLNMPKLTGKECLKELRRLIRYDHVPIFINSSSISRGEDTELKALGANYVFVKAHRLDKLMEVLHFILQSDWANIY